MMKIYRDFSTSNLEDPKKDEISIRMLVIINDRGLKIYSLHQVLNPFVYGMEYYFQLIFVCQLLVNMATVCDISLSTIRELVYRLEWK